MVLIRSLLMFFVFMIAYSALKTIFRAISRAYHHREGEKSVQAHGEEMLLDPQCRTYVIRGRAIVRRINGQAVYFCSEDCAAKHEASLRA